MVVEDCWIERVLLRRRIKIVPKRDWERQGELSVRDRLKEF